MEPWLLRALALDDAEAVDTTEAVDPSALVRFVLREAQLSATEDLRYYVEAMQTNRHRRKAVRDYLTALRAFAARVARAAWEEKIDPRGRDEASRAALAKLFDSHAHPWRSDEVGYVMGIPERVPAGGVSNFTDVDREIATWEERLNELAGEPELANVDLQNILQKQQQTLQMMSNISKMLYDTAQSIIRKTGG